MWFLLVQRQRSFNGASMIAYKNIIILVSVLVLTSCASHYSPEVIADPYGLFSGIWHGMISSITISVNIFSWLLSLVGISFLTDIQIIGRPNTGLFYYLGFLVGFAFLPLRFR